MLTDSELVVGMTGCKLFLYLIKHSYKEYFFGLPVESPEKDMQTFMSKFGEDYKDFPIVAMCDEVQQIVANAVLNRAKVKGDRLKIQLTHKDADTLIRIYYEEINKYIKYKADPSTLEEGRQVVSGLDVLSPFQTAPENTIELVELMGMLNELDVPYTIAN